MNDRLDLEHFGHRVIQDALAEATAAYWLRRARVFEAVGNARCDETAQACRNAAVLAGMPDTDTQTEAVIAEHLAARSHQ